MPRNFLSWYRTPITSMSAARGIWWRATVTITSPPPSFPSSDGCRRRRDFRPVGRKLIPPASSRPALSQRRMQRKMELGMQAEQVALAAERAAFERTQAAAQAEFDRERAQITAAAAVRAAVAASYNRAGGRALTES